MTSRRSARPRSERCGVPVVPIDCAGFYGTKNLGNRIAGDAMVKHVIGTREPDPLPDVVGGRAHRVYDVNLIGEYNIAGELWHVMPLFDELGLRVLCTLSGDARFREVQTMHRAQVNMMVCSKALLNVARKLQEKYGTPWFEGSIYGVADTSQALRDFARLLADPDLSARTEALIAREEGRIHEALEPWRTRLKDKRVLLYTGGVKSWSIISALQDLGMVVVATGTTKSTEEDKQRIRELMGPSTKMIDDGNPRALLQIVKDYSADILIAGGRNMYTALKAKVPFLDINQEREFGYAGYEGMLELARQLTLAIESPVWEAVKRPTPWEPAQTIIAAQGEGVPTREKEPSMITTTTVLRRSKALSVSPLKASATIGASLAFMGFDRAMPLMHGAQGCTAFGKVFFVRHFREPIPLQTTAMDQISSVMGADENIVEALQAICSKQKPSLIGLPTTGLAETQGADIRAAVRQFRERYPEFNGIAVVPVNTPDYSGCFESGYAAAVRELIDVLVPETSSSRPAIPRRRGRVNVLVGSALTVGDLEALEELIEAFELSSVIVPDLADSLDGHLTEEEFNPLTYGGTTVAEIGHLGRRRRDAGHRPIAGKGRRPAPGEDRRARLSVRPPARPRGGRRTRLLPAPN